jgi:hypothetical protein
LRQKAETIGEEDTESIRKIEAEAVQAIRDYEFSGLKNRKGTG